MSKADREELRSSGKEEEYCGKASARLARSGRWSRSGHSCHQCPKRPQQLQRVLDFSALSSSAQCEV